MRMGMFISESGRESRLKLVFSSTGLPGLVAETDEAGVVFLLHEIKHAVNKIVSTQRLTFFIDIEMPHLVKVWQQVKVINNA